MSSSEIVVSSLHQVRHQRLDIGVAILEDHVQLQAKAIPKNLQFSTLLELRDLFVKAAELAEERIRSEGLQSVPPTAQPGVATVDGAPQ